MPSHSETLSISFRVYGNCGLLLQIIQSRIFIIGVTSGSPAEKIYNKLIFKGDEVVGIDYVNFSDLTLSEKLSFLSLLDVGGYRSVLFHISRDRHDLYYSPERYCQVLETQTNLEAAAMKRRRQDAIALDEKVEDDDDDSVSSSSSPQLASTRSNPRSGPSFSLPMSRGHSRVPRKGVVAKWVNNRDASEETLRSFVKLALEKTKTTRSELSVSTLTMISNLNNWINGALQLGPSSRLISLIYRWLVEKGLLVVPPEYNTAGTISFCRLLYNLFFLVLY